MPLIPLRAHCGINGETTARRPITARSGWTARYGLAPGDVAKLLEVAYKGRVVSEILDEDRRFDLVVRYDERARSDPETINQTILETPLGRKVALGQVDEVLDTSGPNTLNRENVQRRIVVSSKQAPKPAVAAHEEHEGHVADEHAAADHHDADHEEHGGKAHTEVPPHETEYRDHCGQPDCIGRVLVAHQAPGSRLR